MANVPLDPQFEQRKLDVLGTAEAGLGRPWSCIFDRILKTFSVVPLGVPVAMLDDLVQAAFAGVSFRLLFSAYAGPCCRLRRSSDDAEQDIGFSHGYVDRLAISVFAGGSPLFIAVKYDQTGNGRHYSETTPSAQPEYLVDAAGLSYMQYDGSAGLDRLFDFPTAYPYSVYSVAPKPDSASRGGIWSCGTNAGTLFISQEWQSDDKLRTEIAEAGGAAPTVVFAETPGAVVDTDLHFLRSDFTSNTLRGVKIDGVNEGTDTQTRIFPPGVTHCTLGRVINIAAPLIGRVYEFLEFDAVLSTADTNIVGQNQAAFYSGSYTDE